MSDERWQAHGGHPPIESLFLHLEGELNGREAKVVARHVEDCWLCRAQCDRLSQGIFRFIESCEQAVLPAPPASHFHFHRRLREQHLEDRGPSRLKRWSAGVMPSGARPFWRSLLVGGMSVSAAAAIVLVWAVSQNGAAAQLLEQAKDSSRTLQVPKPRTMVYQKVRIHHRGRVIDRAVYHGANTPVEIAAVPDPEMQRALDSANIRWDDPLSIDDFAAWRKAQFAKWDTVAESRGGLELRTKPLSQSPIRQASLKLSKLDRHPIERRVEFWDGPPVEVTEIALEIREIPVEVSVDRVTSVTTPAKPLTAPDLLPLVPIPGHAEGEVEHSEIRLRAAFHHIGADVREAPEIWRSGERVFFRVTADGPARREEILRAAEGIPFISEAGSESQNAPAAPSPSVQVTTRYSTTPPLTKALRDHLGSYEEVNRYLSSVRDAYFRLLAESVALDRLGKRYTAQTVETLTPEVRAAVSRITNDHIENIQRASSSYFELLGRARQAVNPKENAAASMVAFSCSGWQKASGLVAEDLRRLHLAFFRLFVQYQVEQPIELSAEVLLAESDEAQKLMQEHLAGLCPVAQ